MTILPIKQLTFRVQDLKSKFSEKFNFVPRQRRKRRVLAVGLALLIFLIPLTYLTLRIPEAAEAAWFDDDYAYRQLFSFTHNATISTERAITVSLDTAELITAGVMQSDCDDTRFTDINGLVLRYELTGTCNNAATTYEVVFPSIINGTNPAYVYYGNPSATSASVDTSGITALTPSGGDPSITTRTNEEKGPGPVLYIKFNEAQDDRCDNSVDDACNSVSHSEDALFATADIASTTATNITTSTDEGGGAGQQGWKERVYYDPNNKRWHVLYIDSENDAHSQSTAETSGTSWTDGIDILAPGDTVDYNDFSCVVDDFNSTTYLHCARTRGGEEKLFYTRCELTGTTPYIANCVAEQTVYDGPGADAFDMASIILDSNRCALIAGNYWDFSAAAGDQMQIWLFKETPPCADGLWSTGGGQIFSNIQSEAGYDDDYGAIRIESYGGLDAQIYWTDIDDSASDDLETIFFDGDTNTFGTQVTLEDDLQFGATQQVLESVIVGDKNVTFGADDNTDDIDAYILSSRDDLTVTQVDTNINTGTQTSSIDNNVITAIVDTNASGADDIWLFGVYLTDKTTIRYNTSTDGGSTWGGSTTEFVDSADDEVKYISAEFNPENCDILVTWLGRSTTPWNIDTKVINTGNCPSGTEPSWQAPDLCMSEKCAFFDGTADVAAVTNTTPIDMNDLLASGLTYQTWVRVNSDGEGNAGEIFEKGASTYLRTTNEGADGYADLEASLDLTTPATLSLTNGITLNRWHHVAMAYTDDGDDEITVYIDGLDRGSSTNGVGAPDTDDNNLLIGGSSNNNFHGFIDEFKVYPYQRTSAEIKTDFIQLSSLHGSSAALGIRDYSYLSEGLVGYWKMDDAGVDAEGETSTDSSGNGNDGTLYGDDGTGDNGTGMDCTAGGKFGTGCDFDGTDDYVEIQNDASLNFGAGSSFSFSAWIKSNGAATIKAIYRTAGVGAVSRWVMEIDSDVAHFQLITTGAGDDAEITGTTNINNGAWHHVAGTRNGQSGKITLYVNGLSEGSPTGTHKDSLSSGVDPRIGSRPTDNSEFFDGLIDDVRVYNRAFSPSEVSDLYNWGPGPVGYWSMDENTGTTAYDRSGNANNGTMTSMTESSWVPGKFGSALKFDGSADYVDVGTLGNYGSEMDAPISVSFWMKWNGTDTAIKQVLGTINTGTTTVLAVDLNRNSDLVNEANATNFYIRDESGDELSGHFESSTPYDGNWHHLSFVSNPSAATHSIYLDGVAQTVLYDSAARQDVINNPANFGFNLLLGALNNRGTPSNFSPVTLDDVRFYNYVRTPSQIIEDMNAGHPAPGSPIGSALGHWKFDEGYGDTAYDAGTGGNDLDLVGSCPGASTCPSWTLSGKFDKALDFDGTEDYVSTSTVSDLQITGDMTFSAWVNTDTIADNEFIVGEEKVGGGETEASNVLYLLRWKTAAGNDLAYKHEYSTGSDEENTSTPFDVNLSTDTWYHIAFVRDTSANTVKLYVNGKQGGATFNYTNDPTGGTDDIFTIGADRSGGNLTDGQIDEVKLYTTVLTVDQIKGDMNKGSAASFGDIANQDNEGFGGNPPVGWWKMDENTGTGTDAVKDTSGNNNHGDTNGSMTESDWVPVTRAPRHANGLAGSALDFDGTNDYLDMGDITTFDGLTAMTISAWVKPDTIPSGSDINTVIAKADYSGAGTNSFFLRLRGTEGVRAAFSDGTDQIDCDTSENLTANTWTHLTAVLDTSDNCYVYYNTVQKANSSNASFDSITNTSSTLKIASSDFGSELEFDGLIDDVRIYDYARTQAQVAYDFNRGYPLGYWKLDECEGTTANDNGSGGNDGTITIGATGDYTAPGTCSSGTGTHAWNAGTTGKRNASLGFDGTNDYISVADSNELDVTGDITLSAWIYADSLTSGDDENRIVLKGPGSHDDNLYTLDIKNSLIKFVLHNEASQGNCDDSGKTCANGTTTIQTGQWYHFAATYDGATAKVFLNGVEDGSNAFVSTGSPNANSLFIGGRGSGSVDWFDGRIDEVKIWNYTLTADQIKRDFNNGAQFFGPLEGSP